MKTVMILSLVASLAAAQHVPSWKLDEIAAQAAPAQPCCKACTVAGQEKYYSIDKVHNMCGECCMKPSSYKLYKIFEPGLTKATDNSPCGDNKFHTYDSTVTHGFGPVKMTLDLYKPDASSVEKAAADPSQPCCKACTVAGQVKYYSVDKIHNMCGECCMKPSSYKLYKIFEPGLTLATDSTPCGDNKFHTYDSTVTHGFGPVKMTLDLYKPDADAATQKIQTAFVGLTALDAKAVGCCGKKITGGTAAVSTCMVNLCTAGAYKPPYCSASADTLKGIAACTGSVASCSLKKCALHCLGGSCSAGCTACVKSNCDSSATGFNTCLAPLGYSAPADCDGSLKSC